MGRIRGWTKDKNEPRFEIWDLEILSKELE
jgi:hypothetical protein